MNTLTQELQSEAERREAAFVAKLGRIGRDDLAAEYNDIITIRNAIEVMDKRSRAIRRPGVSKPTRDSSPTVAVKPTERHESNGNVFVLSEATRDAIREIKQDRFRALRVFEILSEKHPNDVSIEKRRSIAATLSNLVTNGELSVEKDSQRKSWYRVVRLKNGTSQQQLLSE